LRVLIPALSCIRKIRLKLDGFVKTRYEIRKDGTELRPSSQWIQGKPMTTSLAVAEHQRTGMLT
jgi:hypothetical protein